MKITKTQAASLKQLIDLGGAVIASDWTNGQGRFTTSKAIPPFCDKISRLSLHRDFPARIKKVFGAHPKCQSVIAVVDMRGANRALKEIEK